MLRSVSVRSIPFPAHHPPALAKAPSGGPSPRSATPTRIQAPRNRGQAPQHMTPSETDAARTSTPPQRKRNTGRRRAAQRSQNQTPADKADSTEPEGSTDDDLFELLGVPDAKTQQQQQQPGLIQLSKESMDAATNKNENQNQNRRSKPRRRADAPFADDTPASSEPDQREQPQRPRRGKKGAASKPSEDPSGVAANASGTKKTAPAPSPDSSYDMGALSRSLPPSFFAEAQNEESKKKDKWEMPSGSPTNGGQALTWQQQLQNENTPSKNSRNNNNNNNNNGRRGSKAPKAGGHERHASLDHMPVSGIATIMNTAIKNAPASSSPGKASVPVSAFDSSIPFHTGFNVHRAPQTPLRAPKRSTAVTAHDGVLTLPIVGDFPRINRASAAPLGGIKYAGPTFHNSPASGSLPKPDLDDF